MKSKLYRRSGIAFLCALLAAEAAGDELPLSFQKRMAQQALDGDDSFWTLVVENDLFGGGTDRNYTSGVRATYFDVGADLPRIAQWLEKYAPVFKVNPTTTVSWSLGQNLYTPEDIGATVPDPADRPYAAFLYGSAGFSTVNGNHIDDLELTLGVVGPWALGEETQRYVHQIVDSDDPKGWSAQLENEPGIIVSWQRRWPEAFATSPGDFHIRMNPHLGITLGNVYTYAAAGATLQVTPKAYSWQSQPPRVRPAIPGSGFFSVPEGALAWSLFAGFEGRAMARNLFLDGNTFRDSPSVNRKPWVMDASAGAAMALGRFQVTYTLNWRSREFSGQDDPSVFGAISLGYRFH